MSLMHRERFVAVPVTLNVLCHPDYRSSYLETYLAIRSRVSLSPANDNYSRCFPGIETIGEKFGQTRTTVIEAIAWLEANGYLYKQRRRRDSNLYTSVLRREGFIQVRDAEGIDHAKEHYEAWLKEQRVEARAPNPSAVSKVERCSPNSRTLKSDKKDIKNSSPVPEPADVIPRKTSRGLPSEKSSPADPDLDPEDLKPLTTHTPELDVSGKAPTAPLPPGPFSRRKDLVDLDPGMTSEEWDARFAAAKAKAARMLEEEAKKKGGA